MSTQRGAEPGGDNPDTDADPDMLQSGSGTQPDQAEGADDPSET